MEPIPALGAAAPVGPMASHLGRRLDAQELREGMASYNDEDPGLTDDDYERIWAFDLPELVGREVAAARPELLLPALASILVEVLGIE